MDIDMVVTGSLEDFLRYERRLRHRLALQPA